MQLILASTSPRRQALLREIFDNFTVVAPDADETPLPGESPHALVQRLALTKAQSVAAQHPGAVVIGSDTIVVLGERVFGKPISEEDAVSMLGTLSGKVHEVMTAVAVVCAEQRHVEVECVVVRVTMKQNDEATIRDYVATGEPMDKAGAYALQGLGANLIEAVVGDHDAVIGLPLSVTQRLVTQCSQ